MAEHNPEHILPELYGKGNGIKISMMYYISPNSDVVLKAGFLLFLFASNNYYKEINQKGKNC